MTINMSLSHTSCDIIIERGVLSRAGELLDLCRRVMIVTDSGVPREYSERLAAQCKYPVIFTVPEGESNKSLTQFEAILSAMLKNGFSRTDAVAAVGGGMAGDIAGFAAASFMRGVDFYNIPTTLLSQVDSSIGGKTGINLGGTKNIVGAFYQPKRVLIDPDLLGTLSSRLFSEGLAEVIKMALTSDVELFELIERGNVHENITHIIEHSLMIKKRFVEEDEREQGVRKMLNFGHTIGHAIEALSPDLYHGECVALGMLPMCGIKVRQRLEAVLKKYDLPTSVHCDKDAIFSFVCRDKKVSDGNITITRVETVGEGRLISVPLDDMKRYIDALFESAI